MDNTEKFSGFAADYVIGRPEYACEFVNSLFKSYGFSKKSVVADVGSGTGKFAKQLMEQGCFVYCVEPNRDMREAAAKTLGGYDNCAVMDGTAANTFLKAASVDFITSAQAFHWFEVQPFQEECRRILRPGGRVFLIWNMRDLTSELNQRSSDIYEKYCPNFKGFGGGIQKDDKRIKEFFGGEYQYLEFDNPLLYDKGTFIHRSLSGSYSLKEGDKAYSDYISELERLFDQNAKDGILTMANKTVVYTGKIDTEKIDTE